MMARKSPQWLVVYEILEVQVMERIKEQSVKTNVVFPKEFMERIKDQIVEASKVSDD